MFGRAHAPLEFDARKLGPAFKDIRAPLPAFAPFGGMMLDLVDLMHFLSVTRSFRSFAHVMKRFSRYGLDRLMGYHRGTRLVGGNALIARFYKTILDRKIEVWMRASATKLISDAKRGRGGGSLARRQTDADSRAPRRGHRDRRLSRKPGHAPGTLAQTDGRAHTRPAQQCRRGHQPRTIRRRQAGSQFGRHGLLCADVRADDDGGEKVLWAHFMLDRPMPGFIAVGKDGNRFTNEAASYHAFTLGMFNSGAIPAFLIADAAAVKKYGSASSCPALARGRCDAMRSPVTCISGRTLLSWRARSASTRTGSNTGPRATTGLPSTGVDEDFGKGSSRLQHIQGRSHAHAQPLPRADRAGALLRGQAGCRATSGRAGAS